MRLRLWILLNAWFGPRKMRNFVQISPAGEMSSLEGNLKIVSFTHNNGGAHDPNSFKTQFNPAVAIVIVVFLSILFFMAVFSIYIRRCIMDDDRPGLSARVGPVNNDNDEAPRGLERSVIESFPVFSYSIVKGLKADTKGSECAVCLSDFQSQEMLRLLPKCSHSFHPECVDMWLCSHTTCPLCRTSLLPDPVRATTEVAFMEASIQPPPPAAEQFSIVTESNGSHSIDEGAPQLGNDFAGHSLIRVQKEMENPTEWYIATADGLTPGLRKSCSFQYAQGPSCSNATSPSASLANAGCGASSERWGSISVSPASFLRTFSERFVPQLVENKRFNGRIGALG